jgi:tRNA(Ile)-lysidine synthase
LKVPIREIVTKTLQQPIALPPGRRVLAAVSGGSDSVALALILKDLHDEGRLVLAAIGHVNHQLRGAESDADEAFVASLAARLGVPFVAGRVDVAAAAAEAHESTEAAARRLRYAWLHETADAVAADVVATGHTVDDQAETVLLRLLRGTGTRGLGGIRPVRGRVIRPLLECRRDALRAFVGARGETFREDASNADLRVPRNAVRHVLLPAVARLAPHGVDALARAARMAQDDENFLARVATETARDIVLTSDAGWAVTPMTALDPAIGRRVLRMAVERVSPAAAARLSARHLDAMWTLVASGRAGRHDAPGARLTSDGATWRVTDPARESAGRPVWEYALAAPGSVVVAEANYVISARRDLPAVRGVETKRDRRALEVVFDGGSIKWPLVIRNRRPGDCIKPLGGIGRKKVQDLLVDAKVPQSARDRVPVVVDAGGQVLWVVGVAPAECRGGSPEAEMVIFRAERG